MESSEPQLPRTHNLDYAEHKPSTELPSVVAEGEHGHHHGGGGDEHHQEHGTKAVIKKVKAKAKKIKETLTKHGHGHEHHEHHEDDDDDEEMVEDPEVHGAPMYESAAIRGGIAGPQTGVNLEKQSPRVGDGYDLPHITETPTRPFGAWQEEKFGHAPPNTPPSATPWTTSGQEPPAPTNTPSATPWMNADQNMPSATAATHVPPPYAAHVVDEHTHMMEQVPLPFANPVVNTPSSMRELVPPPYAAPVVDEPSSMREGGGKQPPPTVRLGPSIPSHLDEDPQAPRDRPLPSNYESKVSDPTATGEEARMGTLLQSMDKMRLHDEAERHRNPEGYTGSHDQFSPETNPPLKSNTNPVEDMPRDTFTGPESSYVGKISSATTAITDKAVAAKNVVASKLGYGGGEAGTDKSSNTSPGVLDYGNELASAVAGTLAPVYGKVAGAGSKVISKVSGSGGGGGSGVGSTVVGEDKGVSVKEYLVEKLRPGEEDEMLSEVITHSLYKDKEGGPRKVEEEEKRQKPTVTVTETVEVRKGLGSDTAAVEEKMKKGGGVAADSPAAGQAVVERVKGWFGMGSPKSKQSSGAILAGKKEEGSK